MLTRQRNNSFETPGARLPDKVSCVNTEICDTWSKTQNQAHFFILFLSRSSETLSHLGFFVSLLLFSGFYRPSVTGNVCKPLSLHSILCASTSSSEANKSACSRSTGFIFSVCVPLLPVPRNKIFNAGGNWRFDVIDREVSVPRDCVWGLQQQSTRVAFDNLLNIHFSRACLGHSFRPSLGCY